VLLIGLDAADPVLVDRWIDDGTLPRLGALKKAGAHGRLQTTAKYLAGSPWPTFFTGRPPSDHGIYHDFQWRHERMEYARPSADWISAAPFWRSIDGDVRAVVYDVPMVLGCSPFPGTELSGWASHDRLGPPASHPPELLHEIRSRFGDVEMPHESYGPSSPDELVRLRDDLLENTRGSTEVARWVLERPWDLGIVVFSALHRGGHRLFDRTSIAGEDPGPHGAEFDGALRELYVACDRAVGELIDAFPDATVIVFSLHGMMANTCRVDLLDEMLARVLRGPEADLPKPGLLRRLGETLPLGWRRYLTARIPTRFRNRLMTLWTEGGTDWAKTEAFTLRADLAGYVRVNLAGREARGIVPRERFDELCARIADGLASFRDAATGEPLVEQVHRRDGLFANGPRSDLLPDLIVRWSDSPGRTHEAIVSDRFGRIERTTPGRIPNGRSGNHRGEGVLFVSGKGIPAGSTVADGAHILDLAPTVLELLGAKTGFPLAGKAIPIPTGGR
jgi:predicted AlkP superfamily phosphohydrolase/phosphomutase